MPVRAGRTGRQAAHSAALLAAGARSPAVSLAGGADGLAHLEVLLCAGGGGAQEVDNAARPPGGISD